MKFVFSGEKTIKTICLQCRRPGFNPWLGKIPWRREQLPTLVFWPGEFHGLLAHRVAKSQTLLSNFHLYRKEKLKEVKVKELVTQSCPSLCDPMDCRPPGSSVHGTFQSKNSYVGILLKGIFPTQGSNLGLLHCRQILYCLSHQGSPRNVTKYGLKFCQPMLRAGMCSQKPTDTKG